MDEYDLVPRTEDQIRATRQVAGMEPVAVAHRVQEPAHHHLRRRVLPFDRGEVAPASLRHIDEGRTGYVPGAGQRWQAGGVGRAKGLPKEKGWAVITSADNGRRGRLGHPSTGQCKHPGKAKRRDLQGTDTKFLWRSFSKTATASDQGGRGSQSGRTIMRDGFKRCW